MIKKIYIYQKTNENHYKNENYGQKCHYNTTMQNNLIVTKNRPNCIYAKRNFFFFQGRIGQIQLGLRLGNHFIALS